MSTGGGLITELIQYLSGDIASFYWMAQNYYMDYLGHVIDCPLLKLKGHSNNIH